MNKTDEKVLVVPASQIKLETTRDTTEAEKIISLAERLRWFYPRSLAETDESLKQVIPYILVKHRGPFQTRYLMTTRINQTEERLNGKKSLGIGGHINLTDTTTLLEGVVMNGIYRELMEEISFQNGRGKPSLKGMIYDPSTPVSRVHVALVYEVEANSPEFKLLEPHTTQGEWVDIYGLNAHRPAMESWSQIALDQFILV